MSTFAAMKRDMLGSLTRLDKRWKSEVLVASTVFPRTSSLLGDGTPTAEVQYEGTKESLAMALTQLKGCLELKALGTQLVIYDVVECMCGDDVFDLLSLDAVDGIALQRLGRPLVRLVNTNRPANAASGRTAFLDLNDVRQNAALRLQHIKATGADHGVSLLWAGVVTFGLTVGTMAVALVSLARRR